MVGFSLEGQKPLMAMVATQCIYAVINLVSKAAFNRGFSTMVFVVYRQSIATLFLFPFTLLAKRGRVSDMSLNFKGFGLVFLASLTGVTMNQSLYYQGVHLGSPSMAAAMANLIPAITFVMAASIGLETVKLRSFRSWAKILGTMICVGGAMTMAFFKGPKLLNMSLQNLMVDLHTNIDKWVIGGLYLMGASSFWSLWLILQVPICESYSDPLSLSAWTCLMSALQAAGATFYVHPDLRIWHFTSLSDLFACIYAGFFGSAVTFYLQSWCISVRGPLYSAMFSPLSTVITTVLSSIILHEELHIGSFVGATAIIGGLYVVLWGKTEDLKRMEEQRNLDFKKISISIDTECQNCETDIQQALLTNKQRLMGSFSEGLYTFETKEVSTFAPQGRINEELYKRKSYERMYTIKYGPFTLGDIKWEIRLLPYEEEELCYYLCLLDDAVVVKKFGYISLVQDHSRNGDWKIHMNEEKGFEVDPSAKALGLTMVLLTFFSKSEQDKYCKDDCFLNKFVLWVIADDSRKASANAVRLGQPHQPEFISPNLYVPSTASSTLLVTGDFADIVVLVKKDTFAAHRCVLAARSSVFRSELLALQKDINMSTNNLCVSVQNIDGLTFKHLLHFIYTDTLPPDFEEVTPPERYHRMFVAAHRFKIEGLKLICEQKLTKVVADAMITAIDLSEYHESGQLKIVQHD